MSPITPTATSFSTVYAVKQALFAQLQADASIGAASPPVGVFWARPNYDHSYYEVLYFTEASNQIDFASLGRGTLIRDENLIVKLHLSVVRDGTDAQAAEGTWWVIEQAIENVLLLNYQEAGDSWARLADYSMQVETASDGIVVTGELEIHVFNRLR